MASPAAILQVFVNANTKVASAQLAAFEKQLQGVGKTMGFTGGGMAKFTKGAAAAGAGIAAVGIAAGVAGKQLYDLGKEFDAAYDRIRVGTGATGRELEQLKKSFKDVAKDVPNDFEEVGTAIADLNTRLGLSGKPLERMAENMLHLSNITGDDLETNIKAVSRSFVDWEVTVPKQTRYLNGMFRVSQASGASISELADSVQKFGSPLRQLGFDFEEAVSMFASFERAGVNTQTMVPGLKLAISNLTRPTETLAEQMNALGIVAGKPEKALRQIFDLLGSGSSLSKIDKTGLAMDVFGKRAGADMAEAIGQGRFELDKFLNLFGNQKGDTIRKAADETYDFSENVKILGNNLKVFLEPMANDVFVALDQMTRALNQAVKELDGTSKKTTTLGNVLKVTREVIYGVGKVFQMLFRIGKRMIEGLIQTVSGFVKMFKGSFQIVTGILTGNWGKALNGAKTFASGAFKAIGGIMKSVTAPARSAFQAVYEVIRDKFGDAYRAVAGFVNKILSVISLIPGVEMTQISVSTKGNPFGEGSSKRGKAAGLQRGGILRGGSPAGDSIPAMLERGEYVLNRKAVEKIGVKRLNHINFKTAARFQTGGPVGLQEGGYLDTLTEFPAKFVKPVADAGTAALSLLMNGPGQFLKMLPKPNIPQPFTGVGPYVLEMATAFIKKAAQSPLKDNEWVDSNTFAVAKFLASKFNASISSSYRSPAQNAAVGGVPNSSHTRGTPSNPGAFDFVPPSGGMQSFAGKNIAGIVENMIHDVGSGLHNHIAFFQRGGSVGRRKKGKGDWVKTGYTVFDDPMGYRAPLRGKAYAELGAPNGGVGYISQLLGINKELPYNFPLDVKVNGKIARMYKRDIGTGQGTSDYSIDIWRSMWNYYGLNQFSKGPAWMRTVDGSSSGPTEAEIAKRKEQEKRRKKVLARLSRSGLKLGNKKLEAKINGNAKALNFQSDRISLAEKLSGASFGPGGSDETPEEIAKQVKLYNGLLELQKARARMLYRAMAQVKALVAGFKKQRKDAPDWKKPGLSKAISNGNKTSNNIRQQLIGLVGSLGFKGSKLPNFGSLMTGSIGDTNFRLRELGFTPPSDTAGDSELASLLREQLTISQRNLAIAQAQAPVFQQFLPKFHQGGVVQGPRGAERPIMAQAGEGVFTRDQMRAMGGAGNITVVIEDGAIDSNRIRVEVDGVLQDKISTVRRSTPNRRYSTR